MVGGAGGRVSTIGPSCNIFTYLLGIAHTQHYIPNEDLVTHRGGWLCGRRFWMVCIPLPKYFGEYIYVGEARIHELSTRKRIWDTWLCGRRFCILSYDLLPKYFGENVFMWASPTFMSFLQEREYKTHDYTITDFASSPILRLHRFCVFTDFGRSLMTSSKIF